MGVLPNFERIASILWLSLGGMLVWKIIAGLCLKPYYGLKEANYTVILQLENTFYVHLNTKKLSFVTAITRSLHWFCAEDRINVELMMCTVAEGGDIMRSIVMLFHLVSFSCYFTVFTL
jgi:hypothetical protein